MFANPCLCPRVRLPGTKSFALPWPQGSRWSECKRYARYAVRPKKNALRSCWFSCFLMSLLVYDFCYLKNPKKSAKFAGALARKDDANLLLNRHNSPTDLQSPSVSDCHRSLTPEVWRAWTQTQIPVDWNLKKTPMGLLCVCWLFWMLHVIQGPPLLYIHHKEKMDFKKKLHTKRWRNIFSNNVENLSGHSMTNDLLDIPWPSLSIM